MTHKGSWQRPDDGNYGRGFDGIDWSAKGGEPKEAEKQEQDKPQEQEESDGK